MQDDFSQSFTEWLKVTSVRSIECRLPLTCSFFSRRERKSGRESRALTSTFMSSRRIQYSQIMFLRKSHGSRLNVFTPINDLSALSKSGADHRALLPGQQNDVAIAGGKILGDEYSDHVVKVSIPSP